MNFNFTNILKGINISKIASNTSNTLNVIKKIIPVYKEMKPYITKEKSIFKKEEIKKESNISEPKYNNSITFFQ